MGRHRKRVSEGRQQCEDTGRGWNDVFAKQRGQTLLAITKSWERGSKQIPLRVLRRNQWH